MRALLAVAAVTLLSCIPTAGPPSPTPTTAPTAARPKFELASYMYALQTKGRIRVAVLDAAPPFGFREPNGTESGFEPDLARELAKAIFGPRANIDAVIEWVPVDRAGAVAALVEQRADVALARIQATAETAGAIDISDAYLMSGERVLIAATNTEITDIPSLDAKTVCVTRDGAVEADVDAANPFAKTLALDTSLSCLAALQHGQVDAIAADEAVLWMLAKQDPNTKLVAPPLTSERYVIGTKKSVGNDREGFAAFINSWLADVIRDGTWARVYAFDIAPFSKETRTRPAP